MTSETSRVPGESMLPENRMREHRDYLQKKLDRAEAEVNNLRTLLHDHIIEADRLRDALQHITDYPAGAMSLAEIRAIADAALMTTDSTQGRHRWT